ncbi:MAG: thermonuclease family protein, partial [Kiritimatiellae bacterium]|nr:thermonuclease family protein [Kiritimatiellia bacterium]
AALGGKRWYVYKDCAIDPHPANDGDSFHVRTKSRKLIVRLYFVDAPETDRSFPDRIKAQAQYWDIDEDRVLELGRVAAEFTRSFLQNGFTVTSKREEAQGRSEHPRYYALVDAGGVSLAESLVLRGLARVYGYETDLPDGTPARKVWQRLRQLENQAQREGRGAWALRGAGRASHPATGNRDRPCL